jgi:hypothetical protein
MYICIAVRRSAHRDIYVHMHMYIYINTHEIDGKTVSHHQEVRTVIYMYIYMGIMYACNRRKDSESSP